MDEITFFNSAANPKPDPDKLKLVSAKEPKAGDEEKAVAKERGFQAELDVDGSEVAGAIHDSEAEIARVLDPMRKLANTPPFIVQVHRGKASVDFAKQRLGVQSADGSIPFAYDPRPTFVREHFAEIEAEVRKKVVDWYAENDPLVLTEDEKRKRLTKIADDRLASERRECAAIWAARRRGIHIRFRPDTDPRAILGIDGPPPSKRR